MKDVGERSGRVSRRAKATMPCHGHNEVYYLEHLLTSASSHPTSYMAPSIHSAFDWPSSICYLARTGIVTIFRYFSAR